MCLAVASSCTVKTKYYTLNNHTAVCDYNNDSMDDVGTKSNIWLISEKMSPRFNPTRSHEVMIESPILAPLRYFAP